MKCEMGIFMVFSSGNKVQREKKMKSHKKFY